MAAENGGKAKQDTKAEGRRKSAEGPAPVRISRRRLWLFRLLAATLSPLLLLLMLELVLRVTGFGYPPNAIIKTKLNGRDAYCDNVKFGWRFFPKTMSMEMMPFIFPSEKSENTCRIFVLGASVVQGVPEPAYSFSRHLERMLRQQYPGVGFEVINTGMTAINSHVVVEVAKDCAKHQPDLIIVYLGNNEVVGPYGPGTILSGYSLSLSLIRLGIKTKSIRLGQLLSGIVDKFTARKRQDKTWHGMEMFTGKQVRPDDPCLARVCENFGANLEDICTVCRNSGAKVILCTVGSNLKDSPPFASLHRANLTDEQKNRWEDIYQRGAEYELAGDYNEAIAAYVAAAEIDDYYADLQYRLGLCYLALEQHDQAHQRFAEARRLDTLRFRPDREINETIRTVAAKMAGQDVYLVDTEQAFEDNSSYGAAGEEFFLEHVHLNFAGNYLLAKTVFEQVTKVLPEAVAKHRAANPDLLTQAQCAQQLAYTGANEYYLMRTLLNNFISRPPFSGQLYHDQHLGRLRQRLSELGVHMTASSLQQAVAQYRQAIEADNSDWWLHWRYAKLLFQDMGDYSQAINEYLLVQAALPHSYAPREWLGHLFILVHDYDRAARTSQEAIRIKPTSGRAHFNLGLAYQMQNKTDQAIKVYYQTMRLQPLYGATYVNLTRLLAAKRRPDETEQVYRKGLDVLPNYARLRYEYAMFLARQGRTTDAIEQLSTTVETDPNFTQACQALNALRRKR